VTTTASERQPSRPEKSFEAQLGTIKQLLKSLQLPSIRKPSSDAKKMYKEYLEFLEHYTQREFTVASDKLPALSGIVQSFHEHLYQQEKPFAGSYLAGLWREDLISGLMWQVTPIDETGELRNPEAERHGPSWTWSSIQEEISYVNQREEEDCIAESSVKVISAEVVLGHSHNPAGIAESGRLVLRGRLARAWEEEDEMSKLAMMMQAKMDIPIDAALEMEDIWVLRLCAWTSEEGPRNDGSSDITMSTKSEGDTGLESDSGSASLAGENDIFATAIILEPTGNAPYEYQRIGLLPMWENSFFEDGEDREVTIV